MTSSLVISNFKTGFETDREPFLLNNDAFPTLENCFIWRGRIKKKRGTSLLGRLEKQLTGQALGSTDGTGAFSGNILTILGINATDPAATIKPKSITITVGASSFTEPATANGTLSDGVGGTGTIDYKNGALTLTAAPIATPITIAFSYYPNLPVLGLESFETSIVNFPTLVALDQRYSYQFNQASNIFFSTSFYKNSGAPVNWSGQNYQQFWSANYQGALWVTNGKPGAQFLQIASVASGTPTTITTSVAHNLTNNDFVFINEVGGITTAAGAPTLNGFSGQVTVTGAATFTLAITTAGAYTSGGIVQLMTRSSSTTNDGIRWYDGNPVASPTLGWVNFAPPLDNRADNTTRYLVGCKMIVPFKGRILFFGVYTATSAQILANNFIFNPNQLAYSWDGTAYYSEPKPDNQTVNSSAYWQNIVGRGGFLNAPIAQEVVCVEDNEDVLICHYETKPLKLIFSGDDSFPFYYQTISSELGAMATFSSVSLDRGVLAMGEYGLSFTTQNSAERADVVIPDVIFNINRLNNGEERIDAFRDFRNELIYFTYPADERPNWVFPNRTLVFNYRDGCYSIFEENYTHYGQFRRTSGLTWSILGQIYGNWAGWNTPWNFGSYSAAYPNTIAGNQHGFVMIKEDETTNEAQSQYISNISGTTVTSPNHCLNDGDFIKITGVIGITMTDPDGNSVDINGSIFKISVDYSVPNTFTLVTLNTITGTYLGGGAYARLTNIKILTKQFPAFWSQNRQVRIGTQRFLFDNTDEGQVTVSIFTSQNDDFASNDPIIQPYFPFTNVVLTSPEPDQPYQESQNQIWHRSSNSFVGDTVQVGISLSDEQMLTDGVNNADIVLHAIAINLHPGPILN